MRDIVAARGAVNANRSEKFVRANAINFTDFVACGYSDKEAKAKGLQRTEGKTYVVKDAAIMAILAGH